MASVLRAFSPREARILEAVAARMVETGEAHPPQVPLEDILASMDGYVAGLPPHMQDNLRWALRAFQWGPLVFTRKPRRFTGLSTEDRDTYIRSWAESRFGTRRRVFRALRDLAYLGYYSQPPAQESIGHRPDEVPVQRHPQPGPEHED